MSLKKTFFQSPNWISSAIIFLTAAILSVFYFVVFAAYTFPSEDAAILFAYAENWANTGVVSYYPGGPATEGATDFLFLCFVTLGIKIGLSAHDAALIISALSLLGSIYFLDKIAKSRVWYVRLIWVLSLFLSHQIIPGIYGYGTLLFGFGLIACMYFFTERKIKFLVPAALLTVLARPDGILVVAPLVLYAIWSDTQKIKPYLRILFLYGIVPGLIYFLGRWYYFGELFPLPFYVKAGGDKIFGLFQSDSFYLQVHFFRYYQYPLVFMLGLAFLMHLKKISKDFFVIFVSFILIPLLFYSTTQQDMNLGYRYQYPMYLGLLGLSALFIREFDWKYIIIGILLNIFIVIPIHLDRIKKQPYQIENNYVRTVSALQKFHGKAAATDAGYIGWLSQWEVHDLWGLNTPEFSNKLTSVEDIRQLSPDLVEIAPYSWDSSSVEKTEKTFLNLIQNTFLFLHQNDYQIWRLPYPDPVKPDLVWTPKIDNFFRSEAHLAIGRYTDTVTFGVRRGYGQFAELEQLFTEFGGVRHPNLILE